MLDNLILEDLIMMPVRRSQNWLPSIFNDFFENQWMERVNTTTPAINVFETDNEFKVEVAAPGLKKEDLTIRLDQDNQLNITMEKKDERNEEKKNGRYLRREFNYSKFQQNLILPDEIEKDKIEAKVEEGVLTITIPKKVYNEKEQSVQMIEIK